MTEGSTFPASIEALSRMISGHWATMSAGSMVLPISGSSSGYAPGFSIV
jgi:hypothetical protein